MSILRSICFIAAVSTCVVNSVFAQLAGGSGNNELAPGTEVKPTELSGGGYTGDVNVFTGAYSAAYPLGSVSTPGGIGFSLSLHYSPSFITGNTPSVSAGIPYGEGWSLNVPTVSVTTDAFHKYSDLAVCDIDNSDLYNEHTQLFGINEAEEEGDLYWFAPQVNLPGASGRAVLKEIRTNAPYSLVFVLNTFESYIELHFDGSNWMVILDNGTVYEFSLLQYNYRTPSNQRVFDYTVQSQILSENSLGDARNQALANVIVPKKDMAVWHCTAIYNRNVPVNQGVRFEYQKFGAFNYFKEYYQQDLYPQLKAKLALTQHGYFPEIIAYTDVMLTRVEAYDALSAIEVLELDYQSLGQSLMSQTVDMLNFRSSGVSRMDSLYSYKTAFVQGDATNFINWTRYVHQRSDEAYYLGNDDLTDAISPSNPYMRLYNGSYEYLRRAVTSATDIAFDHAFVESPRMGLSSSGNWDKFIPGDIYEVRAQLSNGHFPANSPAGIGTVDINVVSGKNGADGHAANTRLGVLDYTNSRGQTVFSTFNQSVKWTTGGRVTAIDGGGITTSNLFVMPHLPQSFGGVHIQIGPGNSDNDFSTIPDDSRLSYIVSGTAYPSAYQTYYHTWIGSSSYKLLSGDRVPHNFGVGLPWAMTNILYAPLSGGNLPGSVSQSSQYRFWWNKKLPTGLLLWDNKPTLLDEQVKLKKLEVIRYSKNPYMLAEVRSYKINGAVGEHENGQRMTARVLLEYEVKTDNQIAENKNYDNGDPLAYGSNFTQNIFVLKSISGTPVEPTTATPEPVASLNRSELPTTHFAYSFLTRTLPQTYHDTLFIARRGVALTKVTDNLGGETFITYYDPSVKALWSNRYVGQRYCGGNLPEDGLGKPVVAEVQPLVRYIERVYEQSGQPGYAPKRMEYEYSSELVYKADQPKLTEAHFRNSFVRSTQKGFAWTKVYQPEIEPGKRPYTVYYHIGQGAAASNNGFDAKEKYLYYGRPHRVEQYDGDNVLLEETLFDYGHTLAYKNAVRRNYPQKGAGSYQYEDYYKNIHSQPFIGWAYADRLIVDGVALPNRSTRIRVEISAYPNGDSLYFSEYHRVWTTDSARFDFGFGEGMPLSGQLTDIPWNRRSYIRVFVDAEPSNAYILFGTRSYNPMPDNQALAGTTEVEKKPKFYEYYFGHHTTQYNPSYYLDSYFIKTLKSRSRTYERTESKVLEVTAHPNPHARGNTVDPFGTGYHNTIDFGEHRQTFLDGIADTTLSDSHIANILIQYSPLDDVILQAFLQREKTFARGATIEVLGAQPALSNAVLHTLLTTDLSINETDIYNVLDAQPYLADTVLHTLMFRLPRFSPELVRDGLLLNEYLSNPILIKMTTREGTNALSSEDMREVFLKQGHMSDPVLRAMIASTFAPVSGATARDVLLNQPIVNDTVLFMALSHPVWNNDIKQQILLGVTPYPSYAIQYNLMTLFASPPVMVYAVLSGSPYPLHPLILEEAQNYLPFNQYEALEEANRNENPANALCGNPVIQNRLYMEQVSEYEFFEANYDGTTLAEGYKRLLGLEDVENTALAVIKIKHDPSWQLFRKKSYSPQLPGAYSEEENYYYFDLQNRYDRHPLYYDPNVYTLEPDANNPGDTLIYWGNPTQRYYPLEPDGAVKTRENNVRTLVFEQRGTQKNQLDAKPLTRANWYIYDTQWNDIDTPLPLTDTLVSTPCPGGGSTGEPSEPNGCRTYKYTTWDKMVADVPFLYCAYSYQDVIWFCPFRAVDYDDPEVNVLFCNPNSTPVSVLEPRAMSPVTGLTRGLFLRETVVQVDTLLNGSFGTQRNHATTQPLLDFKYVGLDSMNRPLYKPLYPYDTLRTSYVHERNRFGLPQLTEDAAGLKTRYYYRAGERVWHLNPGCAYQSHMTLEIPDQGMPYKMVSGYGLADSLVSHLEYYPNHALKKITSANGETMQYEYDEYGRLARTLINGKPVSVYSYHHWQNNFMQDFHARTQQNYVESVILQGADSAAQVSRSYVDPLGRAYNALTWTTSDYTASLPVLRTIHSGEVRYDVWDRVFKAYKPFVYTDSTGASAPRARVNTAVTGAPLHTTLQAYENNPRSRVLRSAAYGVALSDVHTVRLKYDFINAIMLSCELNLSLEEYTLLTGGTGLFMRHQTTDEDGKRAITYSNALGQQVAIKQYVNDTETAITLFSYDSQGNIAQVINPEKQRIRYSYNLLGQLYEKESVDAGTVKYMYNRSGQVTYVQDANDAAGDNTVKSYRKYTYDKFGRLVKQSRVRLQGLEANAGFNPLCYEKVLEGVEGGLPLVINTGGCNTSPYANYVFSSRATLDWLADVEVYADVAPCSLGFVRRNIAYYFDPISERKEKELFYGGNGRQGIVSSNIHANALTMLDLPRHVKGRLSHTISYSHADFNSTNGQVQYQWYGYDADGRAAWRMEQFNPNHITQTHKGLLVRTDYPIYNLRGSLLEENVDVNGDMQLELQYRYTYDEYNRLKEVYLKTGGAFAKGVRLAAYSYDDALGHVTETRYYKDSEASSSKVSVQVDTIRYQYDVRQRLTGMHSQFFDYSLYYDQQIPQWNGRAVLADTNHNGNINATMATRNFPDQPRNTLVYGYRYDGLNRLTQADAIVSAHVQGQGANSPHFTMGDSYYQYDKVGNLNHLKRYKAYLEVDTVNTHVDEWAYQYAQGTNRLTQVQGQQGTPNGSFTYDANGNALTDDLHIRGINATIYGRGNFPFRQTRTETPPGIAYSMAYLYDAGESRIFKSVKNETADTVAVAEYFLYGGFGQELGKLDMLTGEWSWYVYDVGRFAEFIPKTNQQPVYYGGDIGTSNLVKIPATASGTLSAGGFTYLNYTHYSDSAVNAVRFHITDHIGNVRGIYTAAVTHSPITIDYETVYQADYYPYGKVMMEGAQVVEAEFGYQGSRKEKDIPFDNYHTLFRSLDAELGRWRGVDPLASKYPSISPYSHVLGNPMMYVDEDGREPIDPRTGKPMPLNLYRASVYDTEYIHRTKFKPVKDKDLYSRANPLVERNRGKPDGAWDGGTQFVHDNVWQYTSTEASKALLRLTGEKTGDYGSPNDAKWRDAAEKGTYIFVDDRWAESEWLFINLKEYNIITVEENYVKKIINMKRTDGKSEYNINSVTGFEIQIGEEKTRIIANWWGIKEEKYQILNVIETTRIYKDNKPTSEVKTRVYTSEQIIK